jgi:hypothetical protein
MKPAASILVASLALSLAGCLFRGTPKTAQAAPVTPKPAVAPAPPPPPPPLSISQTHPDLPAPQPISNEALATTDSQPEEHAPAPAAPKPPRTHTSQPPRTDPPAPAPTVGPTAPEPDVRPPVAPLVPADEKRQLQTDTQHDRQESTRLVERAGARLNRGQVQLKRSVESYLQLSSEAEKRGDLRQAREFAGRALLLAKELQP